jgi:hypothetical protein
MRINDLGNLGIGTTAPNDTFSIGNAGSAPAGSAGTGHNFTSSYLSSDNYALVNYGLLQSTLSGTGGVAKYVGLTDTAYNGNNSGNPGYAYAHGLCNTAYSGSHVCAGYEILNSIAAGVAMPNDNVWIFNGPPAYTASANDCDARTKISAAYGAYWEATSTTYVQGRGLLIDCSSSLKFACCK